MEETLFFRSVQREIEGLVRATGQARYFAEALPRVLKDYAESGRVSPYSEKYREVSQMLWLSGWYVSDFSDRESREALPGFAADQA